MVAGQESLQDTDESKLVRECEERSVVTALTVVQGSRVSPIQCQVLLSEGPELTTGWSLATATALEAHMRMKNVRVLIL